MIVTVASLREPWEAHMLRGRLEAEGIPAFVAHEYYIWLQWDLSVALGGVKLQVPREDWAAARTIERQCRDGEFKALLAEEFGDLDDLHCPHCGGEDYRKRRPFPRAALAVALSMFAGSVLPPTGWIYRCEQCEAEFRHALCPATPGKWPKRLLLSVALAAALFAALYVVWLIISTEIGTLAALVLLLVAAARGFGKTVSTAEPEEPSQGQDP